MKKFWEWMEKKGIFDFEHDECILKDERRGVLTNTMLIGYMEEYLWNKYKMFVGISTMTYSKIQLNFINQRFRDLKEEIENNDKQEF